MCSHPNLLCKSFQSSFLSLGTAFDLFLMSFLCCTTSCLSLLNVLTDVLFSAWSPSVLYCSHFAYCLSYSVSWCEKYSASPCVTAHTLGPCNALLVFLLLLFGCCLVWKAERLPRLVVSWSLFPLHLGFRYISKRVSHFFLSYKLPDFNPLSLDNVCVYHLGLFVCKRSFSCSTIYLLQLIYQNPPSLTQKECCISLLPICSIRFPA